MKKIGILCASVLFLASCGPNFQNIGKESDPTRFYTLAVTQDSVPEGQKALSHLVVGVGPVSVADYLDRSHMVTRESSTRLEIADFDRWASATDKEIQRVLAANLAGSLGTEKLVTYPWKSAIDLTLTVEMNVERFEYAEDGNVHLIASWQVYDAASNKPIAFRRSVLKKASGKRFEDISENLSDLVGDLSVIIAAAIRAS